MNCFICDKTEHEIVLVRLPFETSYQNVKMVIVGNCKHDENICLGCMGFQFDELMIKRAKNLGMTVI